MLVGSFELGQASDDLEELVEQCEIGCTLASKWIE
jgi:hypothetical protein